MLAQHGSELPVVGILGYDLFRRAVIEIPPLAQAGRERGTLTVHDPLAYPPPPPPETTKTAAAANEDGVELAGKGRDEPVWQPLQLVANVPHVNASFARGGGKEHSALFMLDSGAGGAGVMFHARASAQYGLLGEDGSGGNSATKSIRGIGGEGASGGMRVMEGDLSFLKVSGARFDNVLSLIATGGGFDLSLHTAGMICADLMLRCRVIFDYPRRRFAMVEEEEV